MSTVALNRFIRITSMLICLLMTGGLVQAQVQADNDKPYFVLNVEGTTLIRQKNSSVWQDLQANTPISIDDELDATHGRITIICEDGTQVVVEHETIPAPCEDRPMPYDPIPLGPKPNDEDRGNLGLIKPYLIYPRSEIPTFPAFLRWQAVNGASSYHLTFKWDGGTPQTVVIDVSENIPTDNPSYFTWNPAGKFNLPQDARIKVKIDAFNSSGSQPNSTKDDWFWEDDNVYFRILPPPLEFEKTMAALKEPWAKLRLNLRHGYWSDALELVEATIKEGNVSAAWYQQLGNMYLQLDLTSQALQAYDLAISSARSQPNNIVLHETYKILSKNAPVLDKRWCYAEAAKSYFATIQDQDAGKDLETIEAEILQSFANDNRQQPSDCELLIGH